MTILTNIDTQINRVPFLDDVFSHKVFGPIFSSVPTTEKGDLIELLHAYVLQSIIGLKTKGGQYFRRFYENNEDLFWEFRELNRQVIFGDKKNRDSFHKLGREVEKHMFQAESLLTQKMGNQGQWLNKTLQAFYGIVYRFFPAYGEIED